MAFEIYDTDGRRIRNIRLEPATHSLLIKHGTIEDARILLVQDKPQGMTFAGRLFEFLPALALPYDFIFTFPKPVASNQQLYFQPYGNEIVLSIGIDDNRIGRAQSFGLDGKIINITYRKLGSNEYYEISGRY